MSYYLLAIDQGTTNSRAILFDHQWKKVEMHEVPLQQYFPADGWIEHNPEEMLKNTILCCREVLKKTNITAKKIAAIGISNQRETTIIWDKKTGQPVYPAICWQDRRTSVLCEHLSQQKMGEEIFQKTGLLLDPYFSATKILWILDQVTSVRERAEKGDLLFGTVDTYLLWKLTNGQSHATDATNASRTMLFNIHHQTWDEDILKKLNIPACLLPTVLDNAAYFGELNPTILGEKIPITAMAGDDQAATFGQACFHEGMVKATYGTGCFMVLHTGSTVIASKNKLLSTIVYRLCNKPMYGLEGSIFSAGVTV